MHQLSDKTIKVSVLMVTYNHEQYLHKALDSILQQHHDYTIEIVIGDDCSTDGTRDIMLAYKEKYPEIIRLIFNTVNIGPSRNYRQVLEACKGEYIAMLDGDDYWTDIFKLQRQISFLDNNPEFVLSSHRFKRHYIHEDKYEDDFCPELYASNADGFVIDPEIFFSHWVTQTLTVVFRRDKVDYEEMRGYKHFGDVHLFFSVLQKGKGYSHDFFGAIYNFNNNGIWSKLNAQKRWLFSFTIIKELRANYPDNNTLKRAYLIYRFGAYQFEYKELYDKYKLPYLVPKLYWLKAKTFFADPYRDPNNNPIVDKLSLTLISQRLFSDGPKKLSVLMVTYNHEKFIAKALDSVLEQQHPYSFEIVIGDDFSTDNTRAILFDYQKRFPQHIKLIFHSSNIGASSNYYKTLSACRGEYIAMLDGDDYWTDAKKIEKQIQFLDRNPDFVLSCHRFKRHYISVNRIEDDLCPALFESNTDGFEMAPENFFDSWLCQTLTVVFRRDAIDLSEFKNYYYFDDMQLFFCVLQRGKGYAHNFYGGVYNIHKGGVWSKLNDRDKWLANLLQARELLKNYKNNLPLKRAYKIYFYEFLKTEYRKTMASYRYPFFVPKVYGLAVAMSLKNPYFWEAINFWRSTSQEHSSN